MTFGPVRLKRRFPHRLWNTPSLFPLRPVPPPYINKQHVNREQAAHSVLKVSDAAVKSLFMPEILMERFRHSCLT